jgi:hypothetical protein
MLEPHDRTVLLDSLRPPEGYELSDAIGTTFTLDLLALLTAPIGFTLLELQHSEHDKIGPGDELFLLRTLRQYADRLTIFCQAGFIAEPKGQKLLYSTIEHSVIEVAAPLGGVFHPKVWILRYTAAEQPIRYRVLVLSRNLTFSTSWDSILSIDGVVIERKNAFSGNHPLGDFVKALPAMSVRPASDVASRRVSRIESELRRVTFDLPQNVEELVWHPIGLRTMPNDPFGDRIDRICVMSPFLTARQLDELTAGVSGATLISSLQQLQCFSAEQLEAFDEVFALSPDAAPTLESETSEASTHEAHEGLHAKLYVADRGWKASIWTGSANATTAAFTRNVEFLAELRGKKSKLGVDQLLGDREGVTSFRDLLIPYAPEAEPSIDNRLELELERLTNEARVALSTVGWTAEVQPVTGGFDVFLRPGKPVATERVVRLVAQPITLSESWQQFDSAGQQFAFARVSLAAITPFFTLEATLEHEGVSAGCRFVINADLLNEPSDRRDAILTGMLQDRQRLVRFLLLLLFDDEQMLSGEAGILVGGREGFAVNGRIGSDINSLLEPLLRALHRDPRRLDQVEQLLREFPQGDAEERESLIPPELHSVFAPIWAARQRIGK